jgi:hypothetical protein
MITPRRILQAKKGALAREASAAQTSRAAVTNRTLSSSQGELDDGLRRVADRPMIT